MTHDEHRDSGWLPYVGPFVAFVLLAHFSSDAPPGAQPWAMAATALLPAALLIFFARRGAYPELRRRPGGLGPLALDGLVGLASAALWVVPYLVFDFDFGNESLAFLSPDRSVGAGPYGAESALVALMASLRFLGFVLVVPVVEELFIRSFVLRFVQGEERKQDFRDQPIARYTRLSVWITAVVFTLGHAPWEWWVALPWFLATSLWFFYRRTMGSILVVHAVANASIFAFVFLFNGHFRDGAGNPLPLWFLL